ncbi:MAG: urea ABC transporter permease subunit UrtB, partial [Alphaproteobacteria bacterium]|nr:urea ABC transporter permease subunit UrtB [Alphaproteobacteria bacterium]
MVSAANGATVEESIVGLAAKSSADKIAAIDALAASGDDRARDILQAMLDGRLYRVKADDRIVFADKVDGGFDIVDALSGEDLGEVGKRDVKKIKANNKLRGILRGVIGGMSLLSPDANVREAAADAIFKTPTAAIVPILEQAVADEADDDVRDRLERALAAARIATSDNSEIRQAAVKRLAAFTDVDVRAFVGALVIETADGFAEPDAAVRAAANEALEKIDASIARWALVGNLFQGLSLGSVLLLAAIGLAITFGVMGVINMAHGEMVMLGAYTTFVVQEIFRSHFPESFDYSLLVAIPAAFIFVGALGIAIERGIIRFLYGRPLETLLATWGLSLILQQSVRTIFGPTNREVGNPSWMTGAIDIAGSVSFT